MRFARSAILISVALRLTPFFSVRNLAAESAARTPDQMAIAKAHEAFNPDGTLKDRNQQTGIEKIGAAVANAVTKLKS